MDLVNSPLVELKILDWRIPDLHELDQYMLISSLGLTSPIVKHRPDNINYLFIVGSVYEIFTHLITPFFITIYFPVWYISTLKHTPEHQKAT